jgi:hypothetical protein
LDLLRWITHGRTLCEQIQPIRIALIEVAAGG